MMSIEEMSIEELEKLIIEFPTKSACDRAMVEKLKLFLDNKKARINSEIPEGVN